MEKKKSLLINWFIEKIAYLQSEAFLSYITLNWIVIFIVILIEFLFRNSHLERHRKKHYENTMTWNFAWWSPIILGRPEKCVQKNSYCRRPVSAICIYPYDMMDILTKSFDTIHPNAHWMPPFHPQLTPKYLDTILY